jgi:hypothetical protein
MLCYNIALIRSQLLRPSFASRVAFVAAQIFLFFTGEEDDCEPDESPEEDYDDELILAHLRHLKRAHLPCSEERGKKITTTTNAIGQRLI